MLIRILQRLRAPARRTEVCPPALLAAVAPGSRLRAWLSTGWPAGGGAAHGGAAAPDRRQAQVRDEFLQTLADVRTQQAGMLQERIRIARSLRELWHLRPAVFRLVALHYSQAEAQQRLDRLNRHFPTRSPRSGFAALDALPAGDARPSRAR